MVTDDKPPRARRPEGVRLRPRRSPKLIALGLLCIVLGALAAASVYSMNVTTTSVLVMTRDVVRGEQISAEDLAVLQLPRNTVAGSILAEDLDELVGATALIDLPAGAFPAHRHLGDRPLPEGHSLVGLRLEGGRIPSTPLAPGTQVRLVSLAEEDSLVADAVLATAPQLDEYGSHYLLDIVVARESAPQIAALAATNLLAVVAEGDL